MLLIILCLDQDPLAGRNRTLIPAFGIPAHRQVAVPSPDGDFPSGSLEAEGMLLRCLVEGIVGHAHEQGPVTTAIPRLHPADDQGTSGGKVGEHSVVILPDTLLSGIFRNIRSLEAHEGRGLPDILHVIHTQGMKLGVGSPHRRQGQNMPGNAARSQ